MIRKGPSKHESFILRESGNTARISGNPSAFFGYTVGDGRAETDDGIWVKWKWEDNSFELRNDRFGFYPLYYYEKGGEFGVSDSIVELIRHGAPVSLDDTALSVFLRLGYYIGDDTPFKAIRAVPPAARLYWSATEGLRVESGNGRPRGSGYSSLTRAAALRGFGELFQAVIERLLPEENDRIVVPLSGGRDSRHILFALLRSNRAPDCCVTVRHIPPRPDEDAIVASEVARLLKIPHEIVPQANDLLRAELGKNNLTNYCADEHSWLLPVRDFLREKAFSICYDGIGGDVLLEYPYLSAHYLDLYGKGNFSELAEDMLGPEGYLPRMLHPSLYRRWNRTVAVHHLAGELGKYSTCPNPVSQFYFWNRTRREITLSSWCILNVSCPVVAPYLSGGVYDFIAALPASYFLDHTFHTDAIAAYYPEYAYLPFETKSLPPTRNSPRAIAAFSLKVARYFFSTPGADNYINRASFLLPLLLRGIFNPDLGTRLPHICNKAICLRQLALLASHPAHLA